MSERDYGNLEELVELIDRGSDRLRGYLDEFEGGITDEGEVVVGVRALYVEAVANAAESIFTEYEGRGEKPPSEVIRTTRARQIVKREHPDLAARYLALAASIDVGERWLRRKEKALSGLQTLNKTERDLSGARP